MPLLNHAQVGNIAANALGRTFTETERDAVVFAIADAMRENNKRIDDELAALKQALLSHTHGR